VPAFSCLPAVQQPKAPRSEVGRRMGSLIGGKRTGYRGEIPVHWFNNRRLLEPITSPGFTCHKTCTSRAHCHRRRGLQERRIGRVRSQRYPHRRNQANHGRDVTRRHRCVAYLPAFSRSDVLTRRSSTMSVRAYSKTDSSSTPA
jgi:hypothetical protein